MTSAEHSPVKRTVRIQDGNRWIDGVVRITAEGVYIREKGRRIEYGPVAWSTIYNRGAELYAIPHREPAPRARKRRVKRSVL